MGDCDDGQFVALNAIENAVGPIEQRVPAYPATDLFADLFKLKKERELSFDGFGKPFAVAGPLLVVVIARFERAYYEPRHVPLERLPYFARSSRITSSLRNQRSDSGVDLGDATLYFDRPGTIDFQLVRSSIAVPQILCLAASLFGASNAIASSRTSSYVRDMAEILPRLDRFAQLLGLEAAEIKTAMRHAL